MTGLPRRDSHANSIVSDELDTNPRPSPAPRRSGTRGVRANSTAFDVNEQSQPTRIPPHYLLAPTVPSPFTGTLEASLDAILHWGTLHAATTPVKEELLRPVRTSTNWPVLLSSTIGASSTLEHNMARMLLEEFVFLITRILLPEQIAENRLAMGRLYDRRKQLAIRLVLRYDMLREWSVGGGTTGKREMSVASVPPLAASNANQSTIPALGNTNNVGSRAEEHRYRRTALLPNVWPTLIAAPPGGYTTHGVRERMKHYVTPLDSYLLLSDEEVAGWNDKWLVVRASQIVLQWQWLRQKNETLDEMEKTEWEELDGRAEECEWIAEKKDGVVGKGAKVADEDT
ncbi:hypothetical protein OPT61_g8515 [Boeremia exigua]|uniref:Uncharacterized protein n=1 Tax=Boeremia exigua TaxID=749465 RepID=A0ACC2HXY0_9PLEO|nr:hypothetical protein OPT61_g8515 [Boeremia exigua]